MIQAARALYFTALGLWVGGMATLAFIVAPTLFKTASSRAVAGTLFGAVLRNFGTLQIVLGLIAIVSVGVLRWTGDLRPRTGGLRLGILLLMLLLAFTSQFYIAPAIQHARDSIPNFDSVPAGVPARARFDSLHAWSVRLAGVTLLAGVGLLAWSAAGVKSSDGT